ncbi:unnamed protein product, partial [marine sediment metagenome]
MYRLDDMRRHEIIAYFRRQIKQEFPVTDRDIIIFAGCQYKPWPRKDIDALVILEDMDFVDSFTEGGFEKMIW